LLIVIPSNKRRNSRPAGFAYFVRLIAFCLSKLYIDRVARSAIG
jgi:hypothetical protein